MMESKSFIYDGINSKDMGVMMVHTSTGLFEEVFLPDTNIIEKEIANRSKPYFQRVERKPLSFPMEIHIEDYTDWGKLRKIARWLFTSYYRPLIFESNPGRIFYAMIEGDSSLHHNGTKTGYVTLNVRCDSPYSYTPEYEVNNIEFRDGDEGHVISTSDFSNGTHTNTVYTSNGLTVDTASESWGDIYPEHKNWGDL